MSRKTPNKMYEKVKEKNYPIDKIVELLGKYFGTENKELIEKLKDVVPVFILNGNIDQILESQGENLVNNAIKKVCEKNPVFLELFSIDIVEMIVNSQLIALATNNDSELIVDTLAEYSQVLVELGFNPKEIIFRREKENGEYELVVNKNTPETKRLIGYLREIYNIEKKSTDIIDINDIVSAYNERAKTKNCNEIHIRNHAENDMVTTTSLSSSYKDLSNLGVDFPIIDINNLSEDNKKFLLKFMQAKDPFSVDIDYVLKNINEIFNKNFQTKEELFADPTITMLLTFRNMLSAKLEPHIINAQSRRIGLTPVDDSIDYNRRRNVLLDNNASGCYHEKDNTIDLLIPANPSVIVHELLHCLGSYNGDFNVDWEAESLNEIVNEYLTLQVLKEANPEDFENNKTNESKTNYETAIDALKSFLTTFENKLKQCKLGNATKTLKDFIGEKNYETLIAYTFILAGNNYGKFNRSFVYKGEKISAYSEFLTIYERDKSIIELLDSNERKQIERCLEYHNFINKLVEHYEDFEKGKIIDIPLESELISTEGLTYEV